MKQIDSPDSQIQTEATVLANPAFPRIGALVRAISVASLLALQPGCAANPAKLENIVQQKTSEKDWGIDLPPTPTMYKILDDYFEGKLEAILYHNSKGRKEKEELKDDEGTANVQISKHLPKGLDQPTFQAYVLDYLHQLPAPLAKNKNLKHIVFQYIEPFPNDKKYYPGLPDMLKADGLFKSEERKVLMENKDFEADEWKMLHSFQTLHHEAVGHVEDFNYLVDISPRQNLEFLYCLYVLSHQEGHPVFDYPETIKEIEFGKYSKLKEYFAELMRIAMDIDGEDLETWKKNFQSKLEENFKGKAPSSQSHVDFILSYFKIVDPNFKPWESYKKRQEILRQLAIRIAPGFLEKDLDQIGDEDFKKVLKTALSSSQNSLPPKDQNFQHDAYTNIDELGKGYKLGFKVPKNEEDGHMFFPKVKGIIRQILILRGSKLDWNDEKGQKLFPLNSAAPMKEWVRVFNITFEELSPDEKQKFKPMAINLIRQILLEKAPEKIFKVGHPNRGTSGTNRSPHR